MGEVFAEKPGPLEDRELAPSGAVEAMVDAVKPRPAKISVPTEMQDMANSLRVWQSTAGSVAPVRALSV